MKETGDIEKHTHGLEPVFQTREKPKFLVEKPVTLRKTHQLGIHGGKSAMI
jgi:hypothetical protein